MRRTDRARLVTFCSVTTGGRTFEVPSLISPPVPRSCRAAKTSAVTAQLGQSPRR